MAKKKKDSHNYVYVSMTEKNAAISMSSLKKVYHRSIEAKVIPSDFIWINKKKTATVVINNVFGINLLS